MQSRVDHCPFCRRQTSQRADEHSWHCARCRNFLEPRKRLHVRGAPPS